MPSPPHWLIWGEQVPFWGVIIYYLYLIRKLHLERDELRKLKMVTQIMGNIYRQGIKGVEYQLAGQPIPTGLLVEAKTLHDQALINIDEITRLRERRLAKWGLFGMGRKNRPNS